MADFPKGFKVTKKEVSQKFNMKKLSEGKISAKRYRENKEEIRQKFVEEALLRIENRTFVEGKQFTGHKFRQYSKDYAEKKGVSRGDVNMTFKGDMIDSIREGDTSQTNIVKLQVGDGDVETLKAFNHQTGDTLPKRSFFGLNQKEQNAIMDKIASEYNGEV